jgi:hypothetical protein
MKVICTRIQESLTDIVPDLSKVRGNEWIVG